MSQTPTETTPVPASLAARRADVWPAVAVCGFLVAVVFVAFGQALSYDFSDIDDSSFVQSQPHVTAGLSWSGVVWAFTSGPAGGEWYPLSMLSHMLDCQLYGLWPAGHHLTNLLLHAISAVMLFLVLWRMTAQRAVPGTDQRLVAAQASGVRAATAGPSATNAAFWPSALVAAVFAIHPLRVESVVWIAERRDVLSGLFFVLTLAAYEDYTRHPRSLPRYLLVAVLLALGLMSKSILVTVPLLLLLLDYWPLGRLVGAQPEPAPANPRPARFLGRLILEKLPLLALALGAVGLTMITHAKVPDPLPWPDRVANAVVSYVAYLGQFFVPVGLSPYYSHPEAGWPGWQVASAAALLLAITAAVVVWRRRVPYCFVGWLWYLGMLVPVVGLTSVGAHSRADRYTYLPQIGLCLAVVWSVARLTARWPARRWLVAIGSAAMLAALMACTWRQTGYWQDPKTLWQHAVDCDPKSARAHFCLANAWFATDETRAVAEYRLALEHNANERNIHYILRGMVENALGDIAARHGDTMAAIAHYRQSLQWDSDSICAVTANMNLAGLLARGGKLDEAMLHFQRSSELAPDSALVYSNLAVALAEHGRGDEALDKLQTALTLDPKLAIVHSNLAGLLAGRGDLDGAIRHFRQAIEIDPDDPVSYEQVARLLRQQGKLNDAVRFDERGNQARHRRAAALCRRGVELARQGKSFEAISQFQAAIATAPEDAQAHLHLADALAAGGHLEQALAEYRRALAIDPSLESARQGLRKLEHP